MIQPVADELGLEHQVSMIGPPITPGQIDTDSRRLAGDVNTICMGGILVYD
jgi:hypothetical protein